MAGVMFSFYNFSSLIDLNIGISDRLDENRFESFTILFCDFTGISQPIVEANMQSLLRTSDSIVHCEHYYFFVMPYTDRYGCGIVKKMVEDLFERTIPSAAVCYPSNGENGPELLEALHAEAKKSLGTDLDCLYSVANKEPQL
ncbi:MAG: hypothetical protein JHC35_03925 [Sulfuricurvum sp.]|jgi:hypothetical protein|uniref:hypothetical protein n=1 Tax=Sulfuricurvum sp. TaxID=2025608 RepID=UPI0025DACA8C|nr:hypothetical protein [Sulfuricurvum sp.]MCI4406424.1 hypothetical protein [Sulfuricurvum sp.]